MNSNLPPTTDTGLAPNVAGALAYVLGPLTGILFLVIEKRNPFVRFHAAQSVVFGVVWIVLSIVISIIGMMLGVIPILGWLIGLALSLGLAVGGLGIWLLLMYEAFSGNEWELPLVGHHSRRLVGGMPVGH
jgi:uncharacterized membrane protein